MSEQDRLLWVEDFFVLDADQPAEVVLRQIEQSNAEWFAISRSGGSYWYAFTLDELWHWPALADARTHPDWTSWTFSRVLDLHEEYQSTPALSRNDVPAIDLSWRPHASAPSITRYIHMDADRRPNAIGCLSDQGPGRTRSIPRGGGARHRARPPAVASPESAFSDAEPMAEAGAEPEPEEAAPSPPEAAPPPLLAYAAPLPRARTAASGEPVLEDEGTTPVRYPSIEADTALVPGRRVTITVDLQRTPAEHTQGGPTDLGEQPHDWTELTLSVMVSCPRIELDHEGRGTVTIHRNAASTAASISGTVRANANIGDVASVSASFFHGTRFCGSALRAFQVGGDAARPAAAANQEGPQTRGMIVTELAAEQPDVTVHISKEGDKELDWLVQTPRFDGLPPKLRETYKFARNVDDEVTDLFSTFAALKPGEHVAKLESFGTRLWNMAPRMFRDVYWALWDHYKRPLTIQFITDEPDMPWELMRPAREDESEIHAPLALAHPVARWLERFDGYMRNQLPRGGVFTIAPKYPTASRQLPRAQAESAKLVQAFGAQPVPGTRAAVTTLLETSPPAAPVALLHFAGHGQFRHTTATESSIKLEDGALTASEINRPEVRLGKACRTLVFFNACEVGAVGSIFGEVGGWAEAFLSRQFGGFIAPLWSVEDEDAGVVAEELLQGIVTRHEPIGEVLRGLRAKHGKESPTFYSYLYYGDVTARLAP